MLIYQAKLFLIYQMVYDFHYFDYLKVFVGFLYFNIQIMVDFYYNLKQIYQFDFYFLTHSFIVNIVDILNYLSIYYDLKRNDQCDFYYLIGEVLDYTN